MVASGDAAPVTCAAEHLVAFPEWPFAAFLFGLGP
jgi:hypothetical protein